MTFQPSGEPGPITPQFASEHRLTPGDVARIFGVTGDTVGRWAAAGILPCITTAGGHRRFREADVTALLNRTPPTYDRADSD